MGKAKSAAKGRFTSEIHIGLLVLVLILLSLNFLSNFYLNRLRANLSEEATARFTVQTLTIARTLSSMQLDVIPDSTLDRIREQQSLYGIALVQPPDSVHPFSERSIFASAFEERPSDSALAYTLSATVGSLRHGTGDTYYYLAKLRQRDRSFMLLLVSEQRALAFLEQAGNVIFISGIIAMFLCLVLYFTVYRMIVKPFKILRVAAERAGRGSDLTDGNVDAVIARYQQIIDELQEKEQELRSLHRAAEKRASSVEGFNEYLVGSMHAGLLTCDRDSRLVSLNAAGAKILGVQEPYPLGSPITEVITLESGESELIQDALSGSGEISWRECEFVRKNSEKKRIGYTASQVRDESGAILGGCLLFSDITELHRLRTEIEQSRRQASLGEMAAGLAHQLRNSLGAIVGYGRLLKRSESSSGQASSHADTLLDEASQANTLITKFLELSRRLEPEPERMHVRDCLQAAVGQLHMRTEYQNSEISITCDPELTAMLDPLLIKQAITNLFENALQASSAAGTPVRVTARSDGEFALIYVADEGPGISNEIREKLFTPFYSSRPDGTGLGLALAKRIIELHGGSLSIESAPGEGTTCIIRLPAEKDAEKSNVRPARVAR